MTYRETIKYLGSFVNYEKISVWGYKESLKLDSFRDFLAVIGGPQDSFSSIHIAGSKGKGSTSAFISYILREAGYRVGLYTSPHLADFRERIRILRAQERPAITNKYKEEECFEGKIPKEELIRLVKELKPSIERYNRISKYGPLTFFEIYTALAFLYFKKEKVDFAVIETGLGGRLDATNTINSLVCVITPISYEHTRQLGNTLSEIANEKAGIIKMVTGNRKRIKTSCHIPIVISAPQENEALSVIKGRCKKTKAQIFTVGKDIVCKRIKNGFTVKGILKEYPGLRIKLLGSHQLVNASAAIGAIEGLHFYGVDVNIDSVRKGLYNTIWPGRFEVMAKNPRIILDGAQNSASAGILKKAIKENFSAKGSYGKKYKRLILVLGISDDKDIKGICGQICPLADRIILTRADNPRAASVDSIERIIKEGSHIRAQGMIIKTKSVKDALLKAKEIADKEDLILVTGSLFVVGEVRQLCKI